MVGYSSEDVKIRTFTMPYKEVCGKCGAKRIDQQLGLEKTPEEYVEKMVRVFQEVKRVLRDDGSLWLNLGDSYSVGGRGGGPPGGKQATNVGALLGPKTCPDGLKPKDLCGIPWRVAFALQKDGWVLRQEIIWQKPNPMPESCTDRCTKAHEQIFLFAKARWTGPEQGRFKDISDADARWVALFLETEGNLCVKRVKRERINHQYGAQIAVANANRPLLEELQRIVGAGNILKRAGQNVPIYYWQVSNKVAMALLRRIYPHMIAKRRQAKILIYLESLLYHRGAKKPDRKWRKPGETELLEKLWTDNKACNKFHDPELSYVPEPKYGRWSGCQKYYYDGEAIKEQSITKPHAAGYVNGEQYAQGPMNRGGNSQREGDQTRLWGANGRNKRSVWTVPTQPYKDAHFATFPPTLVEPCILAGTSQKGCCSQCGAPWHRVVERGERVPDKPSYKPRGKKRPDKYVSVGMTLRDGTPAPNHHYEYKTTGWQAACDCGAKPVPCVVLDPFMGSGTVAVVAAKLGRDYAGIELNPEYVQMAEGRCDAVETGVPVKEARAGQGALFP